MQEKCIKKYLKKMLTRCCNDDIVKPRKETERKGVLKMITRSKQNWQIGATVKVGFMTLIVTGIIPTPKDGMPDKYELKNSKGNRYEFTPHYGLERVG